MASPMSKALSPFADKSNRSSEFGSEMKSPFQSSDFSTSLGFGKAPQVPDMLSQSKDLSQKSRLFSDRSTISQTTGGSSFSGNASTSPFPFGKPSTLFGHITNQQSHDNPFQHHSSPSDGEALPWWESPTVGHNSNIFGKVSSPSGKASSFVFNTKEQEVRIPLQQPKAFGSGGLAFKLDQTTPDHGHVSASSFSFGKSSPSNGNKSGNPFKQSPYLAGTGFASKPRQEMQGNGSFLFGKPSTSSIAHKSPKLFQCSPPESNKGPRSQQGMGTSTKSSFVAMPLRQPACYQNASSPFASGLPLLENGECMEDDTFISLAATPSSENTSPEELRWKDYQAKQAGGSHITLNAMSSCPYDVSNICNQDEAPSNRQVFTPNPADHSTPDFKFWNNGTSPRAPSAGFGSQSFGPIQGIPSTTVSPVEAPSPFLSPPLQATPFTGLHDQSQLGQLQSPFGSFSAAASVLSPGFTSISSTTPSPMPPTSCVQAQSDKAYPLQWPQSSLQEPGLSVPSPSVIITPFLVAANKDQIISPQRKPTMAECKTSYKIAAEMPFKFSSAESESLVRHGISSLPDAGCKHIHPRTISLLISKQVFQKTVIRMQSRRLGSLTTKKDRPRVSFLNDLEDYAKRDASLVARQNPKEFLLGTLRLDSSAT